MRFRSPLTLIFAAVVLSLVTVAARPVPVGLPAPAPSVASAVSSTYVNPVIDQGFPDPSLLRVGGRFYAYATNGRSGSDKTFRNMLCASSPDLVHWTVLPDAMPILPSWAGAGRTWAPEVRARLGGGYVAYFTARDAATNQQEVGVATASNPEGPFSSPSAVPLVSQPEEGGAIDASGFVDTDGSPYLVWKNDGNSRGRDTWLWIQRLTGDRTHLAGTPTKLIKEDQPWEGNLVEAPTLWKHGAKYYLFYSANDYADCRYAVGYAVANSVLGPYVKPNATPWLASSPGVCGPGGEDIVSLPGGSTWMAYHTWVKGPGSYRGMSIDRLRWDGDVPVLDGPSRSAEPAPRLR
jgi:beta-xylosidase